MTDERPTYLNIANMVTRTKALGPGKRAAIWVQGCNFRCPGCIAPDWIPFKPSIQLTPQEVVDKLVSENIDGLTFSGGEPMAQAEALAEVARLARKKRELNLICFTGYRYQSLLFRPPNKGVVKLLSLVDVLIDGPYIRDLNNSIGLRGSTNQRIIHLTDRLKNTTLDQIERKIEFKIEDGSMILIGIPTPDVNTALDHIFSNRENFKIRTSQ